MAYSQNYGGIIWTNHAIKRLMDRRIDQEQALKTFRNPDESRDDQGGSKVYIKKFGIETITLIVKRNDKKEWIVVSCWIDPPLPGTKDAKKRSDYEAYKKSSGLKKFFLLFKRQLGL